MNVKPLITCMLSTKW